MRKWLRYLLLSLTAGFMFSTSGQALELGDRVPKLTLASAGGEAVELPDRQLPPPTLVWFPLAWRTPDYLCDKLIHAAKENNATLVIIPIYDYSSFKRMHRPPVSEAGPASSSETESDNSLNSDSAARPTPPPSTPQAEQPSEVSASTPDTSPAAREISASKPEPALKSAENRSSRPDAAVEPAKTMFPAPAQPEGNASAAVQPEGTDAAAAQPEGPAPAEPASPEPAGGELTDQRENLTPEEAQQLFRERVADLAQKYPGAVFICDTDNQALVAYTDSFMTNILPNPDLFIIDAHGYVSWKAFYPGLTTGTLTRAIITARPKQSGQ